MQHKKGNVLKATETMIAHGCNCQGVMGSGVAKQVKKHYPRAYDKYKEITPDNNLIGKIQPVPIYPNKDTTEPFDKIIVNCFTQIYYGKNHKEFNYNKFKEIAKKIAGLASKYYFDVALPRIGAGRGKGNWKKIEKILKKAENNRFKFVVYTL